MYETNKSIGQLSETYLSPEPLPAGKSYIFAIGIDRYQHVNRLNNAVNDVNKVVNLLTSRYQFDKAGVTKLENESAKRGDIHREFRRLRDIITPLDILLIYFSGHGIEDKNDGYWIPVDGIPGDTSTFVSNIEIINFLKKINSFHTLVISDSCFSGTLFTDPERRATVRQRLESIPSRWAMTSGRKEPVSDGQPGQNSPFADSLLLHLEHNAEQALPVTHLYDTVIEDVGSNYQQTPRCEPLRDVGHRGGEFIFHLKSYVPVEPRPINPVRPQPAKPSDITPQGGSTSSGMLKGVLTLVGIIVGIGSAIFLALAYFTDVFSTPQIDTIPKTTTIVTDKSNLRIDTILVGASKTFEFTIENQGSITAYIDPVQISCNDVIVQNNGVDSITGHSRRTYTGKWNAGEVSGSKKCGLVIRGRNVEQPVQIMLETEVVPLPQSAAPPGGLQQSAGTAVLAGSGPIDLGNIILGSSKSFNFSVRNTGSGAATGLHADADCAYVDIQGDMENIPTANTKIYRAKWTAMAPLGVQNCTLTVKGTNTIQAVRIRVKARVFPEPPIPEPAPIPKTFTVQCLTGGTSGIRIWISDSQGEIYEVTTIRQSTVGLKVPKSLENKTVVVNFERNGRMEYSNWKLKPGAVIEVPEEIRN